MTFLDDAIERWAAETPDATAFRFGPQSLTYGQLSRQTNRLARWLAAAGVGRGDRVGIYLHKSIETAVAVFGILKAGAAYVPLDPGAPVSRLRGIVEDCAIRVVLSHRQKAEAGAQLTAAPSPVTAMRNWRRRWPGGPWLAAMTSAQSGRRRCRRSWRGRRMGGWRTAGF